MSVSSLLERGDAVTHEAVVAHVAAGEIDPDEGTVEVLLQRLASAGLLAGGDGGTYRLTPSGQAALMDVSPARPSPAGDATEELSSPADTA
jgi:DNA-binding PadR family transcriptional regulator